MLGASAIQTDLIGHQAPIKRQGMRYSSLETELVYHKIARMEVRYNMAYPQG